MFRREVGVRLNGFEIRGRACMRDVEERGVRESRRRGGKWLVPFVPLTSFDHWRGIMIIVSSRGRYT